MWPRGGLVHVAECGGVQAIRSWIVGAYGAAVCVTRHDVAGHGLVRRVGGVARTTTAARVVVVDMRVVGVWIATHR